MASKPVFLIVPGSFSTTPLYFEVMDEIEALGYEAYVGALPSASRYPPETPATMNDDADFFRGLIEKLSDQGKDVIVVPHSYGGVPATQAIKRCTKADRQSKGLPGGVIRIVYITAFVVPEGGCLMDDAGPPPETLVETTKEGFMRIKDVQLCAKATFPDVDPARAVELVKAFSKHSGASFVEPLTYAAYKHIPASFIFCEQDLIISLDLQRKFIERLKKANDGKDVDVHTLQTGHSPTVSAPDQVAKVLAGIASSHK